MLAALSQPLNDDICLYSGVVFSLSFVSGCGKMVLRKGKLEGFSTLL